MSAVALLISDLFTAIEQHAMAAVEGNGNGS